MRIDELMEIELAMGHEFVSQEETTILVAASVGYQKDAGSTEEEMIRLVDWAKSVRAEAAALSLVLAGKCVAYVDEEGALHFEPAPPEYIARWESILESARDAERLKTQEERD